MTTSTARGAFRYPEAADNSRNVRSDIQRLAEDAAARAALYVESTAALRPAPGTPGRLHRATDTGVVTWDTGSSWDDVAVSRAGGSTITPSAAGVKGLVVKGAAAQSANLTEFQDSAGTTWARVRENGALAAGPGTVTTGGEVGVSTRDADTRGLVVRGAASQTANLAEFQDSAGMVLTRVANNGNVVVGTGTILFAPSDASANNAHALVTATNAAHRGLIVRGAASQSANLAEFQNDAGTVLARVGATGQITMTESLITRGLLFGPLDSAGAGFRTVRVAN